MKAKMMMYECDRCHTVGYEKLIEGEGDGGYTRWERHDMPKGWDSVPKIGMDLCPQCLDLYRLIDVRHKREWKEFKVEEAV